MLVTSLMSHAEPMHPTSAFETARQRLAEAPLPAGEGFGVRASDNTRTARSTTDPLDLPPSAEDYLSLCDTFETSIWRQGPTPEDLELYQRLFREREALLSRQGTDDGRFAITVAIPVADRPRQLENCLESLYQLCERYQYGGVEQGRFRKVSAIIADDSRQPGAIQRNAQLARHFSERGLKVEHFDHAAQRALLDELPASERATLAPIIGDFDPHRPGHKGASPMRNITYLALARLGEREKHLFHFVDSDQEFRVRIATPNGEQDLYAINYFHQIDRLFRERPIRALTGKVVGDPPVSPAVMAGNLLDDILAFLNALARHSPRAPCAFHGDRPAADDAAYHDMAGLFGFDEARPPFAYPCPLEGPHDHLACLAEFARRLDRFFDGEHPTRKTLFQYTPAWDTQPARTIYTGNYVLRGDALEAFIPFAQLRLRMAGPTLGRILQATWGDSFLSANLPMLHRRTLNEIGEAEFRPGVERQSDTIDLGGEIERQFFGDVMLFTMIELCKQGYPDHLPDKKTLDQLLEETQQGLREQYDQTQANVMERLARLEEHLHGQAWWGHHPQAADALVKLEGFIANLKANFGEQSAPQQGIRNREKGQEMRKRIAQAIVDYPKLRSSWRAWIASEIQPG